MMPGTNEQQEGAGRVACCPLELHEHILFSWGVELLLTPKDLQVHKGAICRLASNPLGKHLRHELLQPRANQIQVASLPKKRCTAPQRHQVSPA